MKKSYNLGPVKPPCAYELCDRTSKARGLCDAHYQQQHKGLELAPLKPRRAPQPCEIDGCDDRARQYASGQALCPRHHLRWRKYGDPLYMPKWNLRKVAEKLIAEAVANRDRSSCWLDWADQPEWADLNGWGGKFTAGYPSVGNTKVMWLAMDADGRPRPEAPNNYGLHGCDTPACWNPDHLRWGSTTDNLRDRRGKLNYCQHCAHCNP